ncbi:MAG: DUF3298 domain-containing protein [Aggregatilineales bacterium]
MHPTKFLLTLLTAILIFSTTFTHAQDEAPCDERIATHDAEANACVQTNTITLDLHYPDWLTAYPTLLDSVQDYLSASRSNFLLYMTDEYATFPQDRPLFLEITYEQTAFSENIVSLIFIEFYDIGGLYPLDEIHTFTFDLEHERVLTITDLFTADSDFTALLIPHLIADIGADDISYFVGDNFTVDDLDDVNAYANFAVTEDALILLYPSFRSGPIHAGMMRVEIPLSELAGILDTRLFSTLNFEN